MSIQLLTNGQPLLVPAAGDFLAYVRLTQGAPRPVSSIQGGILTTKTPHCLAVGDKLQVDHCGCAGGMAGVYGVGTVPSTTTFTLAGNPVADGGEATFTKSLNMTGLQLLVELSFEDAVTAIPFASAKTVNGERRVLLEGRNPFHVGQNITFPDPPLSGFSAKILGGTFPALTAKVCNNCGTAPVEGKGGCGCGGTVVPMPRRNGSSKSERSVLILDRAVNQSVADRWATVMAEGSALPSSMKAKIAYWNPTTGLEDRTAGFAKVQIANTELKGLQERLGRLLCGSQLAIGCWHARIGAGWVDETQPNIDFVTDEQMFGSGSLIYG